VCAVVNVAAEISGPVSVFKGWSIDYKCIPTRAMTLPTAKQLVEGVRHIEEQLEANPGHRVLVHCQDGRTRSAMLILAWYMSRADNEASSPMELVLRIKAQRPSVEVAIAKYPVVEEFRKLWIASTPPRIYRRVKR